MGDRRGATLVELVMIMVLVLVLAFALGDTLFSGAKAYLFGSNRNEAVEQGRTALEMIARELRNGHTITTATATELCFTDASGTTLSFRHAGTDISREEIVVGPAGCPGAGGNVLATGITSFAFSYIQADGSSDPAPPAATERVRITLTSTVSDAAVDMETEITPRNL